MALALFTITDFLSYSIWAAICGVVYAIPVPATMSCICEFTHVKNMNNVLRYDHFFEINEDLFLSINAMVAIGGMFTFPILNGMLIDHFGDFRVTFVIAGVCLFLSSMALILARLFNKRKRSES